MLSVTVFAQKQTVSLEDITQKGTFYARSVRGLRSMTDGIHYTTLEQGKRIVKYQYATGKKVAVVFDLDKEMKGEYDIKGIQGYEFNGDESKY